MNSLSGFSRLSGFSGFDGFPEASPGEPARPAKVAANAFLAVGDLGKDEVGVRVHGVLRKLVVDNPTLRV
ncbi:hypothetical protein [Kribbella deserti]|uniref:Uncharacterized protein n=1 Tax=Kribbella deserti TaxID=1926257 RepID=A0ABV6QY74_9ACTN